MNPLQIELRKRIKAEGYSVRGYARKLGLPRSSFARKLAGESDFTLREVGVISAALGYSTPSELMRVAEANASELPDPSGAGTRGREATASSVGAPARDRGGYAIQDEASGVSLLEARHVDLDGGDAA